MSVRFFSLVMCCTLLMCSTLFAQNNAPTANGRIFVLISLDGLAGFYFDDLQAPMPTLRQLAREGAFSGQMRPSTPSVTWPNHTSIVTGASPAIHGVTGNNYFDRETKKAVAMIGDPNFDKEQIVNIPTIYDVAKEAGWKTAAIRWPATRNAKTLDWTFPDVTSDALLESCTTPSLLGECKEAHIWLPAPVTPPAAPTADVKAGKSKTTMTDQIATDVFKHILHNHKPDLALLHLINVDHVEHEFGPRSAEAYQAIADVDTQVKQVLDLLKAEYPNNATVFIVSDHGFSPINRQILPNVILRDAGLVTVKGVRVVAGDVRTVVQGGSAMLYIQDARQKPEVTRKIEQAFANVEGIDRIINPADFPKFGVADPSVDAHSPDVILFAKEGYAFGDTAAGSMSFVDKPERKGTHGHNPDLRNLKAMFIAWGPHIPGDVKIDAMDNTDVAPTMAKLMGFTMPLASGKILPDVVRP